MNNWMLFALLTVVVVVNVYFTYRRAEGVDDKGRKLLAACQLLYLVFIAAIFALGKVFGSLGILQKLQSGEGSRAIYFGSIIGVFIVLVVFLFLKKKLEDKIRAEHAM